MSLQRYFFPFLTDEDHFPHLGGQDHAGLDVYEDENSVVVKAAVPGLQPKDIDITFQKGVLTIRGSKKEEESDKKRRYYKKSSRTFAYQIAVPGNIDETEDPHAELKNGEMIVSFCKKKKEEPKRIPIKNS